MNFIILAELQELRRAMERIASALERAAKAIEQQAQQSQSTTPR